MCPASHLVEISLLRANSAYFCERGMCRGLYHNTWAAENGSTFVSAEQNGIALAEIDRRWRSLREDSKTRSQACAARANQLRDKYSVCVQRSERCFFERQFLILNCPQWQSKGVRVRRAKAGERNSTQADRQHWVARQRPVPRSTGLSCSCTVGAVFL